MSTPTENLRNLGLTLPPAAKPVGSYVPAVQQGDLLFLSGQVPLKDGRIAFAGQVGAERTIEEAQEAARICVLSGLAIATDHVGSIDRLSAVLKLVVYVSSAPGFNEQHKVANGASDLLVDIFGERGRHARAAVGVAELPLDSTVEVDITFAVAQPYAT